MKCVVSALALATIGLALSGCNNNEYEARLLEEQQRWEKLTSTYDDIRKELQDSYKATLFPPEEFDNHAIFTYTLEQFLIHSAHPIMLKAVIDDVIMENKDLFLHATAFFSNYPTCDNRRLILTVRAPKNEIEPLLIWPASKDETKRCCCTLQGPLVYLVIQPKTVTKVVDGAKREAYGYGASDDPLFEVTAELVALKLLPE